MTNLLNYRFGLLVCLSDGSQVFADAPVGASIWSVFCSTFNQGVTKAFIEVMKEHSVSFPLLVFCVECIQSISVPIMESGDCVTFGNIVVARHTWKCGIHEIAYPSEIKSVFI